MPLGAQITIGILILTVLFLLFARVYPRLRKYRLVIKSGERKHKRRVKPARKKRKSVWIKVL